MKAYTHGFAQKSQRQAIQYVQTTDAIFKPSRTQWDCWELDGSKLDDFSSRYKYILRTLIEGRYSLFIVAVDKSTGSFEHLGAFNILQGALALDQFYFSNKGSGYRVFKNIEGIDLEFSNEINAVMNLFKLYPLPFTRTAESDISGVYDFLF